MSSGWHRKRTDTPAEQARRIKYRSTEHQQARKQWTKQLAAGVILACWRCHAPIRQGTRWVVGHDDHQVNLIRGPEHDTCNRHAANVKGARVANAKRFPPRATALRW